MPSGFVSTSAVSHRRSFGEEDLSPSLDNKCTNLLYATTFRISFLCAFVVKVLPVSTLFLLFPSRKYVLGTTNLLELYDYAFSIRFEVKLAAVYIACACLVARDN